MADSYKCVIEYNCGGDWMMDSKLEEAIGPYFLRVPFHPFFGFGIYSKHSKGENNYKLSPNEIAEETAELLTESSDDTVRSLKLEEIADVDIDRKAGSMPEPEEYEGSTEYYHQRGNYRLYKFSDDGDIKFRIEIKSSEEISDLKEGIEESDNLELIREYDGVLEYSKNIWIWEKKIQAVNKKEIDKEKLAEGGVETHWGEKIRYDKPRVLDTIDDPKFIDLLNYMSELKNSPNVEQVRVIVKI